MKFFVFENYDAADAYSIALVEAGHVKTTNIDSAEFLLYDYERYPERNQIKQFIKSGKPAFIYPHTPYSFFLWDGIYKPLQAKCNFVSTKHQKKIMELYGYPYEVEDCGFSRCEIKKFKPFQQDIYPNVLIAPAHGLQGKLTDEFAKISLMKMLDFIYQYRELFGNVKLRYSGDGLSFDYLSKFVGKWDFEKGYRNDFSSIKSIDQADIVFSTNTFAYLSIARGIPTFMYGNEYPMRTRKGEAKHYKDYDGWTQYPLDISNLEYSFGMMLANSRADEPIKVWKERNIGYQFDPQKFVKKVESYL